jgi:hypothetical protein
MSGSGRLALILDLPSRMIAFFVDIARRKYLSCREWIAAKIPENA